MRIRALVVSALPLAIAACGGVGTGVPSRPGTGAASGGELPAAIAVPSGSKLVATLTGSGLQNYECRAKADAAGGYDWVFVSPEAALKDGDAIVGRHYAGPTWEYGDGSKVTGKVLASAAAPQAGNIPWLLLQGTAATTPGTLAGVTYVQRIRTSGGTAPSDPCAAATAGTRKPTRYTADYLFYRS